MEQEDSIFKVEINEKGSQFILRIYRIVNICFWTGILINLLALYSSVHNYFIARGILKSASHAYTTRFVIVIIYMTLFSVFYFLQFYYFLKFSKQAKKSIEIHESKLFNDSLNWVYRAFCMTVIGLALNGLYVIYFIIGEKTFK